MQFAQEILRAKRQEVAAQVSELRKTLRDIDQALELLDGATAPKAQVANGPSMTINDAILGAIKNGKGTPADIYTYVTQTLEIDTTKNSISTRLSKLKSDGLIDNDQDRWVLVGTAKASDVKPSEAFDVDMGPVTGRGTVFPATPPEGSIPSGSTAVNRPTSGNFSRELDDDIPF